MTKTDVLPRDAQSILELAARSMFDLFANAGEGMLLVDRQGKVVWINEQYRRFLPALGFERVEDFLSAIRSPAWCTTRRCTTSSRPANRS